MALTRRGRLVVTLCVTFALLAAAVPVALAVLGGGIGPACRLRVGGEAVRLDRVEAESATRLAAAAERGGTGVVGLAQALTRELPTLAPVDRRTTAARAMLGYDGGALSCRAEKAAGPRQTAEANGLTPRANALRLAIRGDFGPQSLGGFEPGGVDSGHVEGSAHYEGRAIDAFFRPVTAENTRKGWLFAQWAVAHAETLAIATVIFDRRIWTADGVHREWRDYHHPDGPTSNPVLLHLDHVHVVVVRGG